MEDATTSGSGILPGSVAPAERAGPIAEALTAGDVAAVRSLAAGLQAPDMADLLELLQPDQRVQLVQALGAAFDPEVLPELDETVRDQLSEALPNDVLARAVARLETDDAAYVIEGLEKADQQEILAQIPTGDRAALERNLEYPEETAGRLMQTDFVAVPPFWSVGRVIDHMREAQDLPDSFSDIYVVDPTYRVLGSVDLSRLLRTQREVSIDAIMDADRQVVLATSDQEAVARRFDHRCQPAGGGLLDRIRNGLGRRGRSQRCWFGRRGRINRHHQRDQRAWRELVDRPAGQELCSRSGVHQDLHRPGVQVRRHRLERHRRDDRHSQVDVRRRQLRFWPGRLEHVRRREHLRGATDRHR